MSETGGGATSQGTWAPLEAGTASPLELPEGAGPAGTSSDVQSPD